MDSFTFSMMKLTAPARPRHFVVMGVTGSGKTTIGRLLAERIGASFVEGDDLHSPENIAKMKAGIPLDDDDRRPWLDRFAAAMASASGGRVVGACSALKRSYRDRIREALGAEVRFIHLHGEGEVLGERMKNRGGHFMPASLLASQLQALEPPDSDEQALTIDIRPAPDKIVEVVVEQLAREGIAPQ